MQLNRFVSFFLLILCLIEVLSVSAQEKTWKITYQNYSDENKPLGKLKTIVYIGDSASVSLLQLDYNYELGKKKLKTESNNSENILTTSILVRPEDTIKRYIYKDFKNHSLYFETNKSTIYPFFKTFSDSLHNMQWVLNENEKKIDSFLCKAATCFFRGRMYTAWYTTEIPISNGPWKFGGLPGLILEIADTTKTVYWKAVSVSRDVFLMPATPNKVNGSFHDYKQEYNKLYQKIKKSIESANDQNNPECRGCTGAKRTIKSNTPEILIND